MHAPQSDVELRPYLDALRQLDPLLDLVWDPQAVTITAPYYSPMGKLTSGVYDGRWMVIRYDSAELGHVGFHPERGWTLICYVTEYVEQDGLLCMIVDGAYAPVDDRLLVLMRSADQWNNDQVRSARAKLWRQNDAVEAAEYKLDEAMALEGLDRAHFKANYAGGVGNWQGKGADFTAMAEAAATRRAVSSMLGHARS